MPLFLEITEFPYNTVHDGWKEAHMPKTSPIRSAVLVELRLVTDGRTDTGPWLVSRMHSTARAVKTADTIGTVPVSCAGHFQC